YSHSLLYTFDCYTQQGINATLKLNLNWLIQTGLSAGCDTAPWNTKDAKPTFNVGVQYTWNDGNDSIYPVLNALNDGKYAYNNLNAVYVTWYHKFRGHPSWHTSTEYWYMWEKHVPNVGNAAAASLLETNANGASCNTSTELTCFAPEWAAVNYFEKQFSKKNYVSIRNEFFDDTKGQRTGTKTRYTEHLIGWGHWVGTTILLRPELRFERSYDRPAYDSPCLQLGCPGTKKNQFTIGGDAMFFF
ncbi:MAG: outer membrane beta-barrel protein, partial [Blastocatellia bacterium]